MRGVRGVGINKAGNVFVAAYLGSATLSDPYGVALEPHHLDQSDPDPNPYRLHYGQIHRGWWEFIYNNINGSPLRLSTGQEPKDMATSGWRTGTSRRGRASRPGTERSHHAPVSGDWDKGRSHLEQ